MLPNVFHSFPMKKSHLTWITALIFCLAPLGWMGCGDGDDPEEVPEDKSEEASTQEKGKADPAKRAALLKTAQADAERFFQSFSGALQYNDSDRALSFVAPDHQYKFGIAYPFWQGRRFYDAKVIDVTGNLMRVQVSFEVPTGKRDREIKKLQRVNGEWRLQDDF